MLIIYLITLLYKEKNLNFIVTHIISAHEEWFKNIYHNIAILYYKVRIEKKINAIPYRVFALKIIHLFQFSFMKKLEQKKNPFQSLLTLNQKRKIVNGA